MTIKNLAKHIGEAIKVIYSNGDYDVGVLESIDNNEDDSCYIVLSDSYNRISVIKLDNVIKVDIVDDFRRVDYDDEEFDCNLSVEEFDELIALLVKIGLSRLTIAPFRGNDLEKAYKLLKENPHINKEEFLNNFEIRKYEINNLEYNIKKNRRDLIDLLIKSDFNKEAIVGFLSFLQYKTNDNQFNDLILSLKEYIILRKEFNFEITESNILQFISMVKRSNGTLSYQYLPFQMFVQYLGETNKYLEKEEVYRVETVYGYDEDFYLVKLKNNKRKKFSAKLFQKLEPAVIKFYGSPDKGMPSSEGLVPGKSYKVSKINQDEIKLKNGKYCQMYEVDIVAFLPKKEKVLPNTNLENILHSLSIAFEYGDVSTICKRIHEKTILKLKNINLEITGRKNILNYFDKTRDRDYLVFAEVINKTSEEKITSTNSYISLTYPMKTTDENKFLVYVKANKKYITEIYIK